MNTNYSEKYQECLKLLKLPELPLSKDTVVSGTFVWWMLTSDEKTTWKPTRISIFATEGLDEVFTWLKTNLYELKFSSENKNEKMHAYHRDGYPLIYVCYPKVQNMYKVPAGLITGRFNLCTLESFFDGTTMVLSNEEHIKKRITYVSQIDMSFEKIKTRCEELGLKIIHRDTNVWLPQASNISEYSKPDFLTCLKLDIQKTLLTNIKEFGRTGYKGYIPVSIVQETIDWLNTFGYSVIDLGEPIHIHETYGQTKVVQVMWDK